MHVRTMMHVLLPQHNPISDNHIVTRESARESGVGVGQLNFCREDTSGMKIWCVCHSSGAGAVSVFPCLIIEVCSYASPS